MAEWTSKLRTGQGRDAFAGRHQKPILADDQGQSTYLGRVVIELWSAPKTLYDLTPAERDAAGLAILSEPAREEAGTATELLKRVTAALPRRAVQ